MRDPREGEGWKALVRGIRQIERAGGDSRVARLVGADWLQENGEEGLAELTREMVDCGDGVVIHATGMAALHLLYLGPAEGVAVGNVAGVVVEGRPGDDRVWYRSRYAMIDSVSCPIDWWMKNGPRLVGRHAVRAVEVTDRGPVASSVSPEDGFYFTFPSPPMSPLRQSLPMGFRRFLGGTQTLRQHKVWFAHFDTDGEAAAAMNRAALLWAEAVADSENGGVA